MKRSITQFSFCALLGLGTALAGPQAASTPGIQPEADTAQQPARRHNADPNQQVQRLSKRLNLTADQQNQLLPILSDRQKEIQGIRNDNSLAPRDRKEKLHSVMSDTDAKIKALLTDSQKQTFEQMEQQRRSRMQQRHERNGSTNPASNS